MVFAHSQTTNKLVNEAANNSTWVSGEDHKIPPTLGTNYIAGFGGFHPVASLEKNKLFLHNYFQNLTKNVARKDIYFLWYIISMQNRPENCRATRNFLQVYFLLQLHYANEVKPNWHNEIQHLVVCCLPSKDALFFSFLSKYRVKNRQTWITDRIHQNKQGLEGKKLSGKEFHAFKDYQRVCVEDTAGSANCTQRFSVLFSSSTLVLIYQNPSK